MTRADLINMLGVGRASMSNFSNNPSTARQASSSMSTDDTEDDEDDDDDDEEEEDGTQDDDSDDMQDNSPTNKPKANNNGATTTTTTTPKSAKTKDIGGFYAALCALGVGVVVGTKVCCHLIIGDLVCVCLVLMCVIPFLSIVQV
jgi:hypothetical protein